MMKVDWFVIGEVGDRGYECQNTNGSTNESTSVEDQSECQGCNEDFPEDDVGTYYLHHNAGNSLRLPRPMR